MCVIKSLLQIMPLNVTLKICTEMASINILQRDIFLLLYLEYISEPVLGYLFLSKEVYSTPAFTSIFLVFLLRK